MNNQLTNFRARRNQGTSNPNKHLSSGFYVIEVQRICGGHEWQITLKCHMNINNEVTDDTEYIPHMHRFGDQQSEAGTKLVTTRGVQLPEQLTWFRFYTTIQILCDEI